MYADYWYVMNMHMYADYLYVMNMHMYADYLYVFQDTRNMFICKF